MPDASCTTVTGAAADLCLHKQTILSLIRQGKLEAIDVSAGSRPQYRIPWKAIEDFKRRHRVETSRPSLRRKFRNEGREYV